MAQIYSGYGISLGWTLPTFTLEQFLLDHDRAYAAGQLSNAIYTDIARE